MLEPDDFVKSKRNLEIPKTRKVIGVNDFSPRSEIEGLSSWTIPTPKTTALSGEWNCLDGYPQSTQYHYLS